MSTAAAESIHPPRTFGFLEHVRCLGRREILVIVPIYCFGLIPPTALTAYGLLALERRLGLPTLADLLPLGFRQAFFVVCLAVGGAIVTWSYTYLVLEGGGGPVPPFSSQTRYLVTNGPYRVVRHPSIWGKLIGVLGLGVFVGSATFLTIMIPLALLWSLSSNMRRQDEAMERAFGDAYRAYRALTPRLVPRALSTLWRAVS